MTRIKGAAWTRRGRGVGAHLFISTVVTSKVTPFSHSTMKRRWEKGQLPMLWPSLPAWEGRKQAFSLPGFLGPEPAHGSG